MQCNLEKIWKFVLKILSLFFLSFSIVCHAARYFFVWLYCAKGPWNLNTLHSKVSTNWFLFPVLVWVALMMMAETGGWGVSPFPFYQNLKQSLCSDGFLQHHHLSWPLCHLPRTWENAIHCCLQCIPMRGKCNTLRVTWFWAYCRRLQKKCIDSFQDTFWNHKTRITFSLS